MLQREHSAILLTFIKLPFVIKIFVLSIFELPFYTGFTKVLLYNFLYFYRGEDCSSCADDPVCYLFDIIPDPWSLFILQPLSLGELSLIPTIFTKFCAQTTLLVLPALLGEGHKIRLIFQHLYLYFIYKRLFLYYKRFV